MSGALDVTEISEIILDVAQAALDEIPTFDPTLLGCPERTLRTPGLPVDDCCEQLAIHVTPFARVTGRDTRQAGWLNSVTFTLTLGRCVPTMTTEKGKVVMPEISALEASASQLEADGWALWNALNYSIMSDGALPESCGKAAIEPLVSRDPSGGCGGWTATIVLTVDGYRPQPPGS